MHYSPFYLWLKYINREPRVSGMIIGLLLGTPFIMVGSWTMTERLPFVVEGETVQGKVISYQQHNLLYEYADEAGNQHKVQVSISLKSREVFNPGDPIAIRYVRSDPSRSQLASNSNRFELSCPFIGLLIIAGSILYGGRRLLWVNGQVWLIGHGTACPGRITRIHYEYNVKSPKTIELSTLEYEFATAELQRGTLKMRGVPQPNWQAGDGIVIFLHPHDPTQFAPDIFDARQEERRRLFGISGE
jgi:hypothetical protein